MTKETNTPKTVVITGGSAGIGLETAKLLLSQNHPQSSIRYRVALIGKHKDKLSMAQKAISEDPSLVTTYSCDLAKPEQIKETCLRIMETHRNVYGLVNNAGVYPFGGLQNTSEEDWDQTLAVNLKAAFLTTKHLLPALKKSKVARIINISSTAGLLPNHFALAYSVSKAGLIQLTKTLAKELGKDGITVNCLCPGIVKTPLHETYHASKSEMEQFYAKRGAAYPLGRVGETSDIASAIQFYLSEHSSWITGDVMVIDGGRLLT